MHNRHAAVAARPPLTRHNRKRICRMPPSRRCPEISPAMNWFWQFCCASTTALLLLGAPQAAVAAAPPPAAALTPQDQVELQKIARYLDGIHTATAKFEQAAGNGGEATGYLWMSRPGRMRFQYDPPNELLLLADSFYVYSWDPDLKQMTKVGLKSTPAWFLLRQPISFTDGHAF
jgi:hypothetical protein